MFSLSPQKGSVLVTGGSGFVALELVSQLLEKGYTVHTTVRSLQNSAAAKLQPLVDLRAQYGEAKLQLFEADLLRSGSFHDAMQGCNTVFHVASPFRMAEKIKDGQKEMVEPAVQGTVNVLETVEETSSVEQVVLTSSTGAIAGDYADVLDEMPRKIMTERHYNTTSSATHNPYHWSKTLAEQEAWKICSTQRERDRWNLITLCVALVLGPTTNVASESGSLFLMDELLSGWMFYGVPDLSFLVVDVRDVASGHILAAESGDAAGRYIIGPARTTTFLEISKHFKKLSNGSIWIPAHQIPSIVTRILGPLFGLTQKWMTRNLGVRFEVDNSRAICDLNMTYRPLNETLNDHYASWKMGAQGKSKTA